MTKIAHSTGVTDAEATFYATVDAAEMTRQVAIRAATTQAQCTTADINYHRAVVAASIVAGNAALGTPSRFALRDLTGGS